jgi:hypothetical protein
MREHKLAQKEFYDAKAQEEDEADKNKPAFFQQKRKTNADVEPKSSD